RYVWADKRAGGTLYQHLRGARKQRRKRYGRYDSRGRLAGKRPITARPPSVETRQELGHWEADTMLGASQAGPCVLSLVERKGLSLARSVTPADQRGGESAGAAADPCPVSFGPHHHRRQWHGVPRVRAARADDRHPLLLRHPASRLGAWDQRKHQRPG